MIASGLLGQTYCAEGLIQAIIVRPAVPAMRPPGQTTVPLGTTGAVMHDAPSNFIARPKRPGTGTAPSLVRGWPPPLASAPSPSSFHQPIKSCGAGGDGGGFAGLHVPGS